MKDLPAWLQAFAAIVALVIATWTVRETKAAAAQALQETRADNARRDDLRARMIAASIIIDLEVMRGSIERVSLSLFEPKGIVQRNLHGSSMVLDAVRRQNLMASLNLVIIEIPPMIQQNLNRLHWLGQPNGQIILLLVSLVYNANFVLRKIKEDVDFGNLSSLAGWLDTLKPELDLLKGTVEQAQARIEEIHSRSNEEATATIGSPWWTRPPL